MDEDTTSVDSQWGDFFREIGGSAVKGWLAENQQNLPAPAPAPAANGVPKWVIWAGLGVGVLGLILILRRS